VWVKDFTIYRETGDHTAFESTGDLWVRNGNEDRDSSGTSANALSLGAYRAYTEIVVDTLAGMSELEALDQALLHLTAARDRLAAMLG
jgi:hypothetical protein